MTRILHSNRPSGETEPDQLCRPRLLLMLFITTILLMANGARAEWAHDALQRRLSRADAVLVHSWYSDDCCHDRDCHPVPCSEISRDSNGDFIWKPETRFAGPSEQRLPTEVLFPKKRLKVSQDEACHVCISPNTTPAGICIYLPYKA